ncbi:hypothetical protein [Micromonospora sp. NPDC050495]|uniref:hypothetical protein n=1 Tax=Micromonospora sp. NPDC050495 TaxID=3154936 RepID=UPI0033F0C293
MLVEGDGDEFAGVDLADLDLLPGDLEAAVDGHDPLDRGGGGRWWDRGGRSGVADAAAGGRWQGAAQLAGFVDDVQEDPSRRARTR